jgi:beta-fructofuranosidase
VEGVRGDSLELQIKLDPGDATRCGLGVRCSPDGVEQTLIVYDREAQRITINAVQASSGGETYNDERGGPFSLAPGESLELRVFVDRSVIEVFANGRTCLTGRVYPARSDSLGVQLFAQGGDARLLKLDAWSMVSIWPSNREPLAI